MDENWLIVDVFNGLFSILELYKVLVRCTEFFKTFKCGLKESFFQHAHGLMMIWGARKVLSVIEKRRNKGQTDKEKYTSSKDEVPLKY